MDKGDHLFQIRFGNQKVQLIKGTKWSSWFWATKPPKSIRKPINPVIDGRPGRQFDVGQSKQFYKRQFSEVVTKNYDLVVEQDLRIFVMGRTSITSLGNIDMTTPQSMILLQGKILI